MKLYDTMVDLLAAAKERRREIRFIGGGQAETVMSFADLWDEASDLLGSLQSRGLRPGDTLVIFSGSNRRFVVAFWAAVLGGIVPVPVAVGSSAEHRRKLFRILSQLGRATLLTEMGLLEGLIAFARQCQRADIVALLESQAVLPGDVDPGRPGNIVTPTPGDAAFIQYSSGSTGDPKGVVLTHRNLCVNIRAIVEGARWRPDDRALSWMPLTHDMGLIGYHLGVLAAGMSHAIMDTGVFVRRPLRWMTAASQLRATQLCSPNFGYEHFLKFLRRKGLPGGTDLSCVKRILNGAEPISWELCEEFLLALLPYGLRRNTMLPVYGLAEATVGVAFAEPAANYERVVVDRHSLQIGAPLRPVAPTDPDAVSFVKVGTAIRDVSIRIADDKDVALAPGLIGAIQLHGSSVTGCIYGDDAATRALFTPDGWLRTGDCGALVDGQLLVTGREKDLIIVNGQNYYPHDLEEIVARVPGLDRNKVVFAGAMQRGGRSEHLVAFVLYRQALEGFPPLADKLRNIVAEQAGLQVDTVIPVPRIPKTTSGKVQRGKLLRAYLRGDYDAVLGTSGVGYVHPDADPVVAELEQICSEVAKTRKIAADDNLFEVGISSLALTEIVLAIDEKYPGALDISDLFDYPTPREIAALVIRNT